MPTRVVGLVAVLLLGRQATQSEYVQGACLDFTDVIETWKITYEALCLINEQGAQSGECGIGRKTGLTS